MVPTWVVGVSAAGDLETGTVLAAVGAGAADTGALCDACEAQVLDVGLLREFESAGLGSSLKTGEGSALVTAAGLDDSQVSVFFS